MYNFYFGKIIMSIFEATMTLYIFEKYVHSMLLNYEDYRYCVVVLVLQYIVYLDKWRGSYVRAL